MSITLSPRTMKRIASVTAAAALAASATLPALVASAEGEASTKTKVALPAKIAISDQPGYTNDAIKLPVVTGVKWKIGDATTTVAGDATTPAKAFASAPTPDEKGKTSVTVTPVVTDAAAYELPATPTSYTLSFTTKKVTTTVKAPTVVTDRTSKLVTGITIPYVPGVTYKLNNTAVTYTVARKPELKAVTAASNTVTAVLAEDYSAAAGAPLITEWKINTKTTDTQIDPTKVDIQSTDGPGTKDFVTVPGVDGLIWTVDGKDLKIKPGKSAVVKLKSGATSISLTPKADKGFSVTSTTARVFDEFTPLTEFKPAVTADGLTVTIEGNSLVKSWKLGKGTLVVPVGTTIKATLAEAGDLVVTPASGYTVKLDGATVAKGVATLKLAAAADASTGD